MRIIHMKPDFLGKVEKLVKEPEAHVYTRTHEGRFIDYLVLVKENRKSLTFEGYALGKRFHVCINRTDIANMEGGEND